MHKTVFTILLTSLWLPITAQAVVYNVNRSFTNGASTATLTGTLDSPLGHFVIQNGGASPFTNVSLSLTTNANSYNLVNALTGIVQGGQFIIDATPTTLTFNTNSISAADLVFSDQFDAFSHNRYVIGYDASPGFQAAYTDTAEFVVTATLPTVFGTAVPEPSTLLLLGIGAISLLSYRKAKSHG
jgi:hypothetical protein